MNALIFLITFVAGFLIARFIIFVVERKEITMLNKEKIIKCIIVMLLVFLTSFIIGLLIGKNSRKDEIIKDFEERITECEQEYDALNEQYTLLFHEVYERNKK